MDPKTKAAIDQLPEEDIRREIDLGRRSRFQGSAYAYLKTRLSSLEAAATEGEKNVERGYREREIEQVDEANALARSASKRSWVAVCLSGLALLVTVARLIADA